MACQECKNLRETVKRLERELLELATNRNDAVWRLTRDLRITEEDLRQSKKKFDDREGVLMYAMREMESLRNALNAVGVY